MVSIDYFYDSLIKSGGLIMMTTPDTQKLIIIISADGFLPNLIRLKHQLPRFLLRVQRKPSH